MYRQVDIPLSVIVVLLLVSIGGDNLVSNVLAIVYYTLQLYLLLLEARCIDSIRRLFCTLDADKEIHD
jgi:hypothetical protein